MAETLPPPTRVFTRFVSGEGGIDPHLTQEWLLTNGLGGYASGTVLGPITRRYHGLLIAALPLPAGRFMTLHGLSERFRMAGRNVLFAGPRDLVGGSEIRMLTPTAFHLEYGLPVWVYDVWGARIGRRILMPYRQNTVFVEYRYVEGSEPVRIGLRPGVQFRNHDANVNAETARGYTVEMKDRHIEIHEADPPVLRLQTTPCAPFTYDPKAVAVDYLFEKRRGYPWQGSLWSPGYFRADLQPGASLVLKASTEPWDLVETFEYQEALSAEAARRQLLIECSAREVNGNGIAPELVLAADQFIMTPVGRREDVARARATGDEARSVIAGYHWFTDWGRDTMISLEGLTLVTGRQNEAGWILRMFAHYVRDGLIPNLFPEGAKQGLYHTADASLWFFHALSRYLQATGDCQTLRTILPKLREIADAHIAGTRFGIHVDESDALLAQGQEGYQLTWMDANVDNWVVTPRCGKAPVGLRSLAPGEPDYKKRYDGDLRSRDAAYHQGSVWAWLIGPYIDALEKVYPERCSPDLLKGFDGQLDQACVGSISEIFDAEEPHTPRGCIAQAWSVAEVLRCCAKLSGSGQQSDRELLKQIPQ